ncbi:MAG: GGDEF domain-containing protein [Desulfobacterales bacterium]|nr:GGDEF domain-containing protein [Desulfobacterales bacterium]
MSQKEIHFSPEDEKLFSKIGKICNFADGDIIFNQGDMGRSMFYIKEGIVCLIFDGWRSEKELEAGNIFGELAFIMGSHCRTGTAMAVGDTCLIELSQETVEELIEVNPRWLISVFRRTCAYLLESEQNLVIDLKENNQKLKLTVDYLVRTKNELNQKEILANTDGLTRLYNRRLWDQQLDKCIELAKNESSPLCLVMFDLDGFKPINDKLGHAVGDDALRSVAKILMECVSQTDIPCRLGGDEFGVIMPGVKADESQLVCEQLLHKIAAIPTQDLDGNLRLTASIGGTSMQPEDTPESIMQRIDKNVYMAKNTGKNRVIWG